LSTCLLLLLLI